MGKRHPLGGTADKWSLTDCKKLTGHCRQKLVKFLQKKRWVLKTTCINQGWFVTEMTGAGDRAGGRRQNHETVVDGMVD